MHSADLLGTIAVEADRIATLGRCHDLTAPTIGLGRWRVRDVVAHLGGVHRWATRIVTERSMAGPGFRKSKLDGAPLIEWFAEGAEALVGALGAADPSERCPNFSPGSDASVGWWIRRQAHETAVHRWDVERALGEVRPIPTSTAADGVDEFLDTFVRPRGKQTLSGSLSIIVSNPRRTWTLRPAGRAGRIEVIRDIAPDVAATIEGSAESTLLALWGRHTIAEAGLTVSGDRTIAASFRPLGD